MKIQIKHICLGILLASLAIQPIYAQETPVSQKTDTIPAQITPADTANVQIVSIKEGVLPTTLIDKDTISTLSIEDMQLARRIDSMWLQELYSNDRFEEMYGAIQTEEYVPVEYEELPTEVLKQRLKELDARTPFTVEYNPSLESVIKRYLKNRRKYMGRLMALSDYYFPMFEETLDRYNLPLEMKYLAVVESALDPRAQSRVGATGLWQFMFATGKIFDLNVNSYVDDRSDPTKATEAACKYLNRLYSRLGDWDLALAAYNSGPGNVSKAIRRSGGYRNYWNIRAHLPRETAGYVPAFLATMYIFEYAEEHGFKSNGPKFPYIATDSIAIKKQISLEQIADVTNLALEELEYLNPQYKIGVIPKVKEHQYYLRLPIDALGTFLEKEEAIYAYAKAEFDKREKPLPSLNDVSSQVRYRVKSGDYLGKIAQKYGVSVRNLKKWNNLRSNNLKIGQRLTVHPRKLPASSNKNTKNEAPKKPLDYTGKQVYIVQQGDSLWSIAQKYEGVTVDKLKKWNDISSTKLKLGMKLIVSGN